MPHGMMADRTRVAPWANPYPSENTLEFDDFIKEREIPYTDLIRRDVIRSCVLMHVLAFLLCPQSAELCINLEALATDTV